MVAWQHTLAEAWGRLRFEAMTVEAKGGQQLFEAQVYLDDLDPNAVRVELYADGVSGSRAVRRKIEPVRPLVDASGGYVYSATVSATRPAADYTARVVPLCPGVAVPLEAARILWQR